MYTMKAPGRYANRTFFAGEVIYPALVNTLSLWTFSAFSRSSCNTFTFTLIIPIASSPTWGVVSKVVNEFDGLVWIASGFPFARMKTHDDTGQRGGARVGGVSPY